MGGSAGKHKSISKRAKDIQEIYPFNEMNNIDLSFENINDLVEQKDEEEQNRYMKNKNLELEKEIIDIMILDLPGKKSTNVHKDTKIYDKCLTLDEKKYLSRMFLTFSSDNIMSNRQFWNFLDLEFIYNTKFAKLFYKVACEFNDNNKLEYIKFMDYTKFIQFIAIFTKTQTSDKVEIKEQRLRFIFNLFDTDTNDEVDRLEFRNIITCFTEMILTVKFNSEGINEKLKQLNLEAANTAMIETALDNYVDEVYNTFSYNGEYLSLEEWQAWFSSIEDSDKILDFVGNLSSYK